MIAVASTQTLPAATGGAAPPAAAADPAAAAAPPPTDPAAPPPAAAADPAAGGAPPAPQAAAAAGAGGAVQSPILWIGMGVYVMGMQTGAVLKHGAILQVTRTAQARSVRRHIAC